MVKWKRPTQTAGYNLMFDLNAYLQRIGYAGSLEPTLETLTAIHRAHLLTIPYEDFDIHLGRSLPLDVDKTFDKIVTGHRGGWCYEMNGLFAAVLRELGFDVTLLASGVKAEFEGDGSEAHHLILMVKIDGRPYLADVGFGNGILEPIPLEPGEYQQGYLTYPLIQDGDRWFFKGHQYGSEGFVFTLTPRPLDYFAGMCSYLQTAEWSRFVRNPLAFRFTPQGYVMLFNAALTTVTEAGVTQQIVDNPASYQQLLNSQFDLQLPNTAALWEKAWARHLEWTKGNAANG